MRYDELPTKWKIKLVEHIKQESGQDRDKLSTRDFGDHLHVQFADHSCAMFYYAFYIIDPEADEVAVFTEHCGYHIFPFSATNLYLLQSKRSDAGIDD